MNPLLAAVGIAAVAGGVVAVSARQSRLAALGLVVSLVAAPLLVHPVPEPLPLAARLVAAILVGYLYWVALRANERATTTGSRLGWPVEALAAAAAAMAGYGATPSSGVGEASGAAFALAILGLAPVVRATEPFRLAIGLTLLLAAATILRGGLAAPPSPLEHLTTAIAFVALAATLTYLVASSPPPTTTASRTTSPR